MIDFYLMLKNDERTITLKRINELVRATWLHKLQVLTATTRWALHKFLITVKQFRNIPVDTNTTLTRSGGRHEKLFFKATPFCICVVNGSVEFDIPTLV